MARLEPLRDPEDPQLKQIYEQMKLTTGSTRHMDYILTVPVWIEFWPASSGDPVAEVPK
jgi:hypothetical protein